MPELPEVETVRRDLEKEVVGRRIEGVDIIWPGLVAEPAPEKFVEGLVGKTIRSIGRRGKYLLIRLDSGEVLIVHLRMTGQLVHQDDRQEPPRYLRAVFRLDDGSRLNFGDLRKFGRVWLVPHEETVINKLGPEPLESCFNYEAFRERLSKRSGAVKPVLLDQAVLAGIGNIYADEALFAARLHPLRRVNDLQEEELKALYESVRYVLNCGVESRGTTVSDYRDGYGRRGNFQEQLKVFRRKGAPCLICGTAIEKIVVGGRGTHICPKCQRLL